MSLELGVNREWFGAQASLKFLMVKFLGLKWLPHYDDWYKIVLDEKRSDVQSPRGHGKTMFWSYGVPIWDAVRGNASDLLVSYSEDQVRRLIRNVKVEIENNQFLAAIRPTTKEIWGTDMLTFRDGGIIQGLGFGTSARGLHPKRIIGDDVLKDMGGMNPEDQERAWFGIITGMAMPSTQIHVIGTPISFGDLLERLENNPVYSHWKKPAINDLGEPLCPDLFTLETLEMRRAEMGSLNFAREFLLQRIDPATQPFKREYETLYDVAPDRNRYMRVVTICDPAYTEGDGDATAIVTAGITHGNKAYVLSAKEIRRDNPGIIVDELFKDIKAYQSDAVGIKRRKGDAISFSFNERRTRDNAWNFKYVEIKDTKSKSDMTRIGGLVPRWEARSVLIHRNMKSFLDQIYAFRFDDSHKHDDLIDALADCFSPDMARPNTGKKNTPISEKSRQGKPLYQLGRTNFPVARDPLADLYKRLDRRVGEAA